MTQTARTHDETFRCMGSDVRLLIDHPAAPGVPPAAEAAAMARAWLHAFDARLSRFKSSSELCALNADPRTCVPASPLLRAAVRAGLWAAEHTDGLVDPTLVGELESAGYAGSRDGDAPAPLALALAAAPPRRPARPAQDAGWCSVQVDDSAGTIRRPPGLRLDTGGTGKGLAADAVGHMLRDYPRFVVDCGGDLVIGGAGAVRRPYEVEVEHPLTGERAHVLPISGGGVATSGMNVRIWEDADGGFAHHLLDPSTGRPAWTGVVGVTALGATALEAETLAKAALLSGPGGARKWLADRGGLIVREDGDVELMGPVRAKPSIRVTLPPTAAAA